MARFRQRSWRIANGPSSNRTPILEETTLGGLEKANQTETSLALQELLSSGKVQFILDETLRVFGKATRKTIRIHPYLKDVETTLGIMVHEGRHALDIQTGLIPSARKPSPAKLLLAEGRAWAAELDFLARNVFRNSKRWEFAQQRPRELLISIEVGYPIVGVSSIEFARILQEYETLFSSWHEYAV